MGRNYNRTRNGDGQQPMGRNYNRQRGFDQPQSGLASRRQHVYHQGLIWRGQLKMLNPAGSRDGNGPMRKRLFCRQDLACAARPARQLCRCSLNGGNDYAGGTNITAGDLNGLVAQNQKQVLVVDNSGKYRSVRLGDNGKLDDKRAAAMAAEFNASGAILLSALLPQETGYWNPVVTTGADGTATISLTVPERSTAWKFLAKGLSAETLAGEATDDLTVKKDLFGEIKLPLAFTDGDTAEIPVTVHNDAVEKGPIEVVLRTTIGGRRVEETKTIEVTGKGLHEVSFKAELKRPEGKDAETRERASTRRRAVTLTALPEATSRRYEFELVVRAAGHEDIVQRSVPLRPYGVPVFAAASGSSTADGTVWLEAPEGMPAESASMQILVGPTVERSLLDIVLAPAPWCQTGSRPPGLRAGIGHQRRDGLAGPAKAAGRQPRGGRSRGPGPG